MYYFAFFKSFDFTDSKDTVSGVNHEIPRSVSLNVERVSNLLFFDVKIKDERSSIADNDSGSPLIYRIFLPTFVRLPTAMSFAASPAPQIEATKIFFPLHGQRNL